MTIRDLSYPTPNSVKPLYRIISKINSYIEESLGNKYLTLLSVNESKGTLSKYKELWSKIKYPIRSVTNCSSDSKINNSDNYDEKYMKT